MTGAPHQAPRADPGAATPTSSPCPACSAPNPAHARFCNACGAWLSAAGEAERRIVTVMFADLSGFTSLTERADPEKIRDLIAGCLAPLCECVTRWGGFVDKFIGDCVMALFGAPVARENDPELAVRAALDMTRALEEWWEGAGHWAGEELGYHPRLRIGINTGSVVTGIFSGGGARDFTAVGDAVNVASRLQGACDTGRILVGERTYERARHAYDFEEEMQLAVKGRAEPVRARYVVGERAERGTVRGLAERRAPLIGREEELATLRAAWERAGAGAFEVCLLEGQPGMGKSRLVETLVEEQGLEDRLALGRSYPHGGVTSWEPLGELIRARFHVPPRLAPQEAAEHIAAALAAEGRQVDGPALALVLGAPMSRLVELEGHSASERAARADATLQQLLLGPGPGGECSLLVLEDLHWADQATLETLVRTLSGPIGEAAPALLLLVTRPPLPGEQRLAELRGAAPRKLELRPLSEEAAGQLLEALLGEHELPAGVIALILERAEGNPLFLEEILRVLMTGAIREVEGRWTLVADPGSFQVPGSVESLLSARIDALDPPLRRTLQLAAIVGRRFWSGVLEDALVRQPVEDELRQLQGGRFVRAEAGSMLPGEREFLFEHLLVQEVAYSSLLRGRRAELHEEAARWFEAWQGEEIPGLDERIAFHYERSAKPARSLPYLRQAAAAARERGALADADALLRRALGATIEPGERFALLGLAEEIAADRGEEERRAESIEEMGRISERVERRDFRAEADYRRARQLTATGRLEEAREAARAALEGFEAVGDVSRQGDSLVLRGRLAHTWGDYGAALEDYDRSLPLQREAGDRLGEAEVLDRLGLVEVDRGDFERGLDYLAQARRLLVELAVRPRESRVVAHEATALRWLGRLEEAEARARESLELADACGSERSRATALMTLAGVLAAAGRADEGQALAQEAHEFARRAGLRGLEARACLALAEVHGDGEARRWAREAAEVAAEAGLVHVRILALSRDAELALEAGESEAAEAASGEAARLLREHGNVQGPEEAVFFTRYRCLQALERHEEAEAALAEAVQALTVKSEHIRDAGERRRFLEEVHLSRAVSTAAAGAAGESQ